MHFSALTEFICMVHISSLSNSSSRLTLLGWQKILLGGDSVIIAWYQVIKELATLLRFFFTVKDMRTLLWHLDGHTLIVRRKCKIKDMDKLFCAPICWLIVAQFLYTQTLIAVSVATVTTLNILSISPREKDLNFYTLDILGQNA